MPSPARWRALRAAVAATVAAAFALALGLLIRAVPGEEAGRDWTGQLIEGGWMAWTFPVALFFLGIAALLALMTLRALRAPETPRRGLLGIETTRGDRLFITLLGSAFLNLAWLYAFGLDGPPLWGALILCLAYAWAVFRWV
jgi:predicted small integral membrane protein